MAAAAEVLCRTAYDRYSAGDFDGLLELFAEDVEVHRLRQGLRRRDHTAVLGAVAVARRPVPALLRLLGQEQGRRAFEECAPSRFV